VQPPFDDYTNTPEMTLGFPNQRHQWIKDGNRGGCQGPRVRWADGLHCDKVPPGAKRVKDAAQARRSAGDRGVLEEPRAPRTARIGGRARQTAAGLGDFRFNDQDRGDGLINIQSPWPAGPKPTKCTGRLSPALWRKVRTG